MKRPFALLVTLVFIVPVMVMAQQLDVPTGDGRYAHIMPTAQGSQILTAKNAARIASGTGMLTYHGGPVILKATTYAIFWVPPTLQTGASTSMSLQYRTVQSNLLTDYPGHSIANNNTQYYQGPPNYTLAYIQNAGSFGGSYVDTSAYPASGCNDAATPGNCISDAQAQTEIAKVMGIKGWTGGLTKVFLLFTSSGEGSCLSTNNCAYYGSSGYCGYHSHFVNSSAQTVAYANIPYGQPSVCQNSGAPSPNNNPAADTAATASSHELTEAITDPMGNAWYSSTNGEEIGDLCNRYYGYLGWDGGLANEFWNKHYYLVQTEYDNYLSGIAITVNGVQGPFGCFNVGPEL